MDDLPPPILDYSNRSRRTTNPLPTARLAELPKAYPPPVPSPHVMPLLMSFLIVPVGIAAGVVWFLYFHLPPRH